VDIEPPQGLFTLRIDGLIRQIAHYDQRLQAALIERLNRMAQLDVTEKRLPQDSRIKMKIGAKRSIDIVVSAVATVWGESCAPRIIDPASVFLGFDTLGLEGGNLRRVEAAISRSHGILIASGPADSGKQVTAYTMMNKMDHAGRRVVVVEHPGSSVSLPGVIQLPVHPAGGPSMTEAVRAALRTFPDILLIGDIGDAGALLQALEASLSRRVVTTMPFRDAVSGLLTMREWGARGLLLGDAIGIVTSQRLARRLCPACRIPEPLSDPDAATIDAILDYHGREKSGDSFYTAIGCKACACHNGYLGRIALFEALTPDGRIEGALMANAGYQELHRLAVDDGMESLCLDALGKAAQGIISLRELRRVAGDLLADLELAR
jgi:type II secretory ATPase GspE/PulE/Tfp pilus assembly ATPase PilB-like protein